MASILLRRRASPLPASLLRARGRSTRLLPMLLLLVLFLRQAKVTSRENVPFIETKKQSCIDFQRPQVRPPQSSVLLDEPKRIASSHLIQPAKCQSKEKVARVSSFRDEGTKQQSKSSNSPPQPTPLFLPLPLVPQPPPSAPPSSRPPRAASSQQVWLWLWPWSSIDETRTKTSQLFVRSFSSSASLRACSP